MLNRVIIVTLALAALIGGLYAIKRVQFQVMADANAAMLPPPSTVTTYAATLDNWEQTLSAVASLEAEKGVVVAAESAGRVQSIAFEPGAKVAAGTVLLKLDASVEEAELQAVAATLDLARIKLERAEQMLAKQTISQSEYDAADAEFKDLSARFAAMQVMIDKKSVKAPFAGRLGIRLVDVGQYLREGDPIVSLQALDTLQVNFSLPQQALPNVKIGYPVRVVSDAAPGITFTGMITVISPQVVELTRSLQIQAKLNNPEETLLPGMFVWVDVVLPEAKPVLMVPVTSILRAPSGNSLFVVEAGENGQQVRQQLVRLGEQRGDFVAVTDGIEAGEVVVSTGPFKLRNGMSVQIDNQLAPEFELSPRPPDT